jgi:asparagine synthase (glutamine-hydrolysing)
MCGICGIYNYKTNKPVNRDVLRHMTDAVIHRGPDDGGLYFDDASGIGLGFRRLSIIDLSPAGHQPMPNEDETIWITFNGETYNFLEMRPALERKGHRFFSNTDTEVVVHLYEEYGVECVKHLRGMFAFAIWDSNKRRLFLARDRVGQKPLVYTIVDDSLIFASEIKAILQDPRVPREFDIEAIHYYITYSHVPSPMTAFKGIKKLPPAHILVWEKGNLHIERYWNLRYIPKTTLSKAACQERILELLREATKMRLISDVPLGAFLSGGIDSSSVVAMMSQVMDEPVKTYSIGFEEEDFDELRYARLIAEKFGTDHHEFVVKPDALTVLPKLIWHYNEPYADASAIPTYYVSKITRDHVTVALNGDGGDESFAGYPRYVKRRSIDLIANSLSVLPRRTRKAVQKTLSKLPERISRNVILRRLHWMLDAPDSAPARRYGRFMTTFDADIKRNLYTTDFRHAVAHINPDELLVELYRQADAPDYIDKTLYVDVMAYLPDDLLVKVDIASMAVSLEARSPYLDHHLMEFAASLPSNYKLRGSTTKYLLKKSLEKVLPMGILYRAKMGFGVPISRWLRCEMKDYAHEILLDGVATQRGYFDPAYVRALLDEHVSGRGDHSKRIWALLNLELWHRMFIDRMPPGTAP